MNGPTLSATILTRFSHSFHSAAWSRFTYARSPPSCQVFSLLTFMPRPIASLFAAVRPGGGDQVLAPQQQAQLWRTAQAFAAGERHQVEPILLKCDRCSKVEHRPRRR